MHTILSDLLSIRDVDQVGILLALVGLEVVLTWVLGRKYFELKDSACSVAMGLFYAASIAVAAGTVLVCFQWVRSFAFIEPDWSASTANILLAYVLVDFLFYVYHRTIHEVRLGWAAHVNHHSSEQLNTGTALRSSFVEAWMEPLFMIPALLCGIDPVMVVALLSLNHLYQYWLHTRLVGKLGPIEWVMNTPSHHRVHHASNLVYCDRNYAGTFIVWDRLLGSFEPERDEEPCVFGIRHPIKTYNPITATFHEWAAIARDLRSADSLRSVIGYLFQPPGWTPNGSEGTTRSLQAQLIEREARS